MENIIPIALRALQFFWTLLILCLTGNMISLAVAGNPSIVNYTMFTAVFSMLCLLYLIPSTIKEQFVFHSIFPLVIDALNTFFFLIGGIALAAELGVHSCSDQGYIKANKVTNGALNMGKRCHEAQASTAFLWFGFVAYAASLFFSFMASRNSGVNMRGIGGIRRGQQMSQVV